MKKKLCVGLLLSMLCITAAIAKPKHGPRGVYMYGIATSLADSTVYVTEIHHVTEAQLEAKTKFLDGRTMYSEQLRYYLEDANHGLHMTCGVQFNVQKQKLQKQYQRFLNRTRKNKHIKITTIPASAFAFTTLEFQDTDTVE